MSAGAVELLAGVALDLAIGDPRWLPHPVRGLGWLVVRLERLWRASHLPLRLAGALFWLMTVAVAGGAVWTSVHWLPGPYIGIYWVFALLALRDLDVEATRVIDALRAGDLTLARAMVGRIVGRDTAALDESEIVRATVETVAENLSDAVIAPLFYFALAGPVGMAVYKAMNTLDSMVGYKNDRYREFGWAAARADDVANFVPARLSALLVWICAALAGYDARRAVRVTLRDAAKQPSPNSGYPEAAVAGALRIRLGGLNYYRGVPSQKQYLGDAVEPLTVDSYRKTRVLLYGPAGVMVLAIAGMLW